MTNVHFKISKNLQDRNHYFQNRLFGFQLEVEEFSYMRVLVLNRISLGFPKMWFLFCRY